MTYKTLFLLVCVGITACGSGQNKNNGTKSVVNPSVKVNVTLIAGIPTKSADRNTVNDNTDPLKALFFGPSNLVFDPATNTIYVVDDEVYLRKIDQHGVTTLMKDYLSTSNYVLAICLAPESKGVLYMTCTLGELYKVNTNLPQDMDQNPLPIIRWRTEAGIRKTGNETGSLDQAGVSGCYGIAVAPDGRIILGSQYYKDILEVNLANKGNEVRLLAGKPTEGVSAAAYPLVDGPALQATFGEVNGVAISDKGDIFVADPGYSTVRQISKNIVKTLITPTTETFNTYRSKDGSLKDARSGVVNHVAVSRDGKRIIFATPGQLRVILPDQDAVKTLAQFKDGIKGIAVSPKADVIFVSSGTAVYRVDVLAF